MNCEQCVKECKEQGGLCNPPTTEEMASGETMLWELSAEHRQISHVMHLTGGFYRCLNLNAGHPPVEANPADAMRAAGQARLI